MIGDRDMYELLYDFEDDFKKIFKVRVEFDEEMKWSDDVIRQYGGRLRKLSDDEKLLPLRPHCGGGACWSMACAAPGGAEKSRRDSSNLRIWRAKSCYAAPRR